MIRQAKNKLCLACGGRPVFWKDAQNFWFRRPSDAQQFEANLEPCEKTHVLILAGSAFYQI